MSTAIVWFRQDLRLADNPALEHACCNSEHVIPLFIDDPTPSTLSQLGAASRVWLHHSLQSLDASLQTEGSGLILRQGHSLEVLQTLLAETGAERVYWNRVYDPASLARDTHIKASLKTQCEVHSYNACLLREPWETLKVDDSPYKVFTPFWNAMQNRGLHRPLVPRPSHIPSLPPDLHSLPLETLGLLPAIRWDSPMMSYWQVGEEAAMQQLLDFLTVPAADYHDMRDMPAQRGTSRLSPHLHFGEISPQQVVYFAYQQLDRHPASGQGVRAFIREIAWREFAWYLLYHFPHTVDQALDERFHQFPWCGDYAEELQRWREGNTGFPIIDAGLRELWQTGWMHNRVRMIVASLLTKNLLVPWQEGERWFRDTLVDADLANNVLGWQWVAGCGADAAPYFRIFNPILQSQKFDPDGAYIRHWVPELGRRDNKRIHLPRELGDDAGDYPLPIVDLKASREQALACFRLLR
jgi:deoxyribodipyrimidine photo-lyase